MPYIYLDKVCLDYPPVIKSSSLKKHVFNMLYKRKYNVAEGYRAINDLSLAIEEGDRVGVIGRNGAGKSTFLKLLSQIYNPSAGNIYTKGDILALHNLSIGLNMEANGYENIFLLGLLYGKSKQEMREKVKDIEDFTELGNALHAPIRTYSAGMLMRLAFAIITSIDAEILLFDEVISVGDHIFIEKAQQRVSELLKRNKILLLASHSNDIIRKFCNKVLIMDKGKKIFYGDIERGIKLYERT